MGCLGVSCACAGGGQSARTPTRGTQSDLRRVGEHGKKNRSCEGGHGGVEVAVLAESLRVAMKLSLCIWLGFNLLRYK